MRRKTYPIAVGAFLLGLATTSAWRAQAAGGTWAGASEATPQESINLTLTSVKVDGLPATIQMVPTPIVSEAPAPSPPDAASVDAAESDAAGESDATADAAADGAP